MSLYNGPSRGGNRGGKDQFNWDSVKSDKDREFYLGHSVKATTGRWQKGKDVFWYTREKQEEEAAKARLEMQAIKQREEDLMNEALGLKRKTIKQSAKPKLDSQDMAKLLGRTESEEQGQPDPMQDPDAVKGLGYKPNMMTGVASAGHDVLGGIGVEGESAAAPAQDGPAEALPGPPPRLSVEDLQQQLKKQEKAAKKARKEVKKAKKEAKKAKKHKEKDREKPHNMQISQPANGRHSLAAPSNSSDEDLPPRQRIRHNHDHEADLQELSRHRHSGNAQDQDRHRYERYEPDSFRPRQRDRSPHRQDPQSRQQRHDSSSPEHIDTKSRHHNGRRHRHDSPSASPVRRRHRP